MRITRDLGITSASHPARGGAKLLLDFAAGHYLAAGRARPLTDLMSFARASVAQRIGPAGLIETVAADIPRIDHAPQSLEPLGLLTEAAATNLTLNNAASGGYNVFNALGGLTQSNTTFANGLFARRVVTPNAGFCQYQVGAAMAASPLQAYVFSFYASSAAPATLWPTIRDETNATWLVPLNSVTEAIGPTLRRITLAFTTGVGTQSIRPNFNYHSLISGDDVLFGGTQLEIGSQASSPIATAASSVTRAADLPGVLGLNGPHDVALIYDDLSEAVLPMVSLSPGWWPVLARPHLRRLSVHPAGSLM